MDHDENPSRFTRAQFSLTQYLEVFPSIVDMVFSHDISIRSTLGFSHTIHTWTIAERDPDKGVSPAPQARTMCV